MKALALEAFDVPTAVMNEHTLGKLAVTMT